MNGHSWISDSSGTAAIWACGKRRFQESMSVPESGFVWAKFEGVYIYSCYAPPSMSQLDFEIFLNSLVNDAKSRGPISITGDFNAWAVEWGSARTNQKGQALLEAFAVLNVVLLNTGDKPTFQRGEAKSRVDITFVSDCLVSRTRNWEVADHYTNSDHQALSWTLLHTPIRQQGTKRMRQMKWKACNFDSDTFCLLLEEVSNPNIGAEEKADFIAENLIELCNSTMPRIRHSNVHYHRTPVYWWNDEIAELRKNCFKARRQYQRSRSNEREERHMEYTVSRKKLKTAIHISKRNCWQNLCVEVDNDPWGKPYKIIMNKLKGSSPPITLTPDNLRNTVDTLFPTQTLTPYVLPNVHEEIPSITTEELLASCRRLGINKAPGPDGIPNIALKTAIVANPKLFLDVFEKCMQEGVFPKTWKRQKLTLIPKCKTISNDPSTFRPLCMLNSIDKIFERIVADRIDAGMDGSISKYQYGFRKGRSTTDAVSLVISIAENATSGTRWKRGTIKYCAIVTLDIKNAFNTARWNTIVDAIKAMKVPEYLIRLVANYLSNRVLCCETTEGHSEFTLTGGVPQGSVLGPLLWNVMYDGILRLQLPQDTKLVAFADDVAVVLVGKHIEDIQHMFAETVGIVEKWMSTVGLQLAAHKTEALLVTKRKVQEYITLHIGDVEIISKDEIRYLGVTIDARLCFKQHITNVAKKAANVSMALTRLMPNIGGPRPCRRKLLSTVAHSIILYAAPCWVKALSKKTYTRKLTAVQRISTLRVISAFRTISTDALCVISGTLPIDILAEERERVYKRGSQSNVQASLIRQEERQVSIRLWQQRWNTSDKGRWSHRLIPNIDEWVSRQHGEVDFYVCQLLSGHGCFRKYLYRFKHDISPECPHCLGVEEDAEHIFFVCSRFGAERLELERVAGARLTVENVIEYMMDSKDVWDAVAIFALKTMRRLRVCEEERRRTLRN